MLLSVWHCIYHVYLKNVWDLSSGVSMWPDSDSGRFIQSRYISYRLGLTECAVTQVLLLPVAMFYQPDMFPTRPCAASCIDGGLKLTPFTPYSLYWSSIMWRSTYSHSLSPDECVFFLTYTQVAVYTVQWRLQFEFLPNKGSDCLAIFGALAEAVPGIQCENPFPSISFSQFAWSNKAYFFYFRLLFSTNR